MYESTYSIIYIGRIMRIMEGSMDTHCAPRRRLNWEDVILLSMCLFRKTNHSSFPPFHHLSPPSFHALPSPSSPHNTAMFSTLFTVALFIAPAIQGVFADFAISSPKLVQVLLDSVRLLNPASPLHLVSILQDYLGVHKRSLQPHCCKGL
jgi:hypothetical protein